MREMKDSGVQWIGSIPYDWNIAKVGLFYEISLGKMLQPKSEGNDRLQNYLCAANVGGNKLSMSPMKQMWIKHDEEEFYRLHQGDLLVVEGGDVASSAILENEPETPLFFQNALHRVRAKQGHIPFLRYWLMTAKARCYFDLICNRATIAHFTKEKFNSMPIVAPSIFEQKQIAAYLDRRCAAIDALIANQQQQIDKLKQYKQAVITEAVTRGLDPNVRMKDSGVEWIGEVPEGWNIAALKHFATIKAGITLGGERTQLPGYVERPYLRVANVQSGGVDLSHITTLFVSPEEDQKYRLVAGDILMTEGGDRDKLGRGCVWEGQISPCLHQNHVFAIRIVSDKLIPKYLEYLTVSKVGRVYFDVTAIKTTNLACTNASKTMAFTFPLPSAIEQSEIVAFLNAECAQIDALIALKQQKADKLAQYKKSLIYEVVTGKREIE